MNSKINQRLGELDRLVVRMRDSRVKSLPVTPMGWAAVVESCVRDIRATLAAESAKKPTVSTTS